MVIWSNVLYLLFLKNSIQSHFNNCTETRKMLSMILSVILFGHHLSWEQQWVGLVFGGIGLEVFIKFKQQSQQKMKIKSKVAESMKKDESLWLIDLF